MTASQSNGALAAPAEKSDTALSPKKVETEKLSKEIQKACTISPKLMPR